jgi:prepilin-type N-terminal cleavage/methylation domain-containing protein
MSYYIAVQKSTHIRYMVCAILEGTHSRICATKGNAGHAVDISVFFCKAELDHGEGNKRVTSVAKSRDGYASQAGFSLAELLIVVTIILIVAGLSIPSLSRAIDNSRLKGATQTLAAVYQDSRLRATQDDTSYEVLVSPPGITPAQICIDLDGDGTCSPGDPVTTFPAQVKVSNLGVPVPLTAAQLNFPVANTESSAMYTQQNTFAPGVAWNSRGLPCQRSSSSSPCAATAWVQHLQFQRANGDILYGAVSVSPTGRVKTWIYIPSGNGNGQWL